MIKYSLPVFLTVVAAFVWIQAQKTNLALNSLIAIAESTELSGLLSSNAKQDLLDARKCIDTSTFYKVFGTTNYDDVSAECLLAFTSVTTRKLPAYHLGSFYQEDIIKTHILVVANGDKVCTIEHKIVNGKPIITRILNVCALFEAALP